MSLHLKVLPNILLCLILPLCYASLAKAESITLSFTGIVTSTDANVVEITEVNLGDLVEGQYTFDSLTDDDMPSDPAAGLYTASQFSVSVGGFNWSAADNNISVLNNAAGSILGLTSPIIDFYELVTPLGKVSGPSLSGLSPVQVEFNIVDTNGSVFPDDSLPTSLNINDYEITNEVPDGARGGHIIFSSLATGQIGEIRFDVTGISDGGGKPKPDIKANSSDGPVTPTGNLSVTVALNPESRSGDNADWWVAANVSGTSTIDGWYYFDLSTFGFVPVGDSAFNLFVTLQNGLFNLPTSEILNILVSVLPSGTYTFYIAVDMNMDGLLDLDELFFDSVVVNIAP